MAVSVANSIRLTPIQTHSQRFFIPILALSVHWIIQLTNNYVSSFSCDNSLLDLALTLRCTLQAFQFNVHPLPDDKVKYICLFFPRYFLCIVFVVIYCLQEVQGWL